MSDDGEWQANVLKLFGIVSYNIHCNFTNYGSVLQNCALSRSI